MTTACSDADFARGGNTAELDALDKPGARTPTSLNDSRRPKQRVVPAATRALQRIFILTFRLCLQGSIKSGNLEHNLGVNEPE